MIQEFTEGVRQLGTPNIATVSQIGYIDLRVSMSAGAVPADLDGCEGNFNGIDAPESIVGKPEDVFQALRARDVVKDAGKQAAPSAVSPSDSGAADA